MIDFKVPRAKDCVLIDTKKWMSSYSSGLTVHRMSGRTIPTYVAKVESTYLCKDVFKEAICINDVVLVSRVASEVAQYRLFGVDPEDEKYYNVPIMQIAGVFEGGEISFKSLNMLFDKILIRKIDEEGSYLKVPDNRTLIGEIVKIGTCKFNDKWEKHPLTVKIGDKVLIQDNVSTEISLDGDIYFATDESRVVGVFKSETYSLENLEVINKDIILSSYISEKTLNSKLFITPVMNYEDADITEIYNRDLFKVNAADKSLTNIKKDDIVLIDRNLTNYVYLGMNKYFLVSGMNDVEAKIQE